MGDLKDLKWLKYKQVKEELKLVCPRPIKFTPKLKPPKKKRPLICKPTIWDDIVREEKELEKAVEKERQKSIPVFECHSNYLERELYPQLIPAFEKICAVAMKKSAYSKEIVFFDPLDILAEFLYNTNRRYVERRANWTSIHRVYEDKNRPFYPYHLFLSDDEAATKIQSVIRGFLVRVRAQMSRAQMSRAQMSRAPTPLPSKGPEKKHAIKKKKIHQFINSDITHD